MTEGFLVSCRTAESQVMAGSDTVETVRFPRAFAGGQMLIFRKANMLCGDEITPNWGTQSNGEVAYLSFQLVGRVLTAAPLGTTAPLLSFDVLSLDETSIEVDFNKAISTVKEDDVARDEKGNPLTNSDGVPTKTISNAYDVVAGSKHVHAQYASDAVFIHQEIKLVSQYQDIYAPAAFVCGVQYSFALPPKADPIKPMTLTDQNALDRFITGDDGLAKLVNLNRPLVLHIEQGTSAAVQTGVAAGVAYWNKLSGRTIFTLAEPQKRGEFFFSQNIVRVQQSRIPGAGSLMQSDPKTGELLQPGYELQFPKGFADDPWPDNNDPVDVKVSRQIAYVTAHELGHVLGLQHNFANLPSTGGGKLGFLCASVMCYAPPFMTVEMGQQILEGKLTLNYDKQALAYLYSGSPQGKSVPTPFQADQRGPVIPGSSSEAQPK
ncbi:MAG: zinc-dependent metalloprotease [Proteobacteria bacterium]|nr:zinc-dependent metalloprotease [Pseudomonadota bacterium]